MSKKHIKQNKTFLSIVIILFILFGLILYYGGNQIYKKEAKWRHERAVSQLLSAKETIKAFFSDIENDLFFLRELPSTKSYVASDFEFFYKNDVKEIFWEYLKIYKQYFQINIIASSGYEVVRIYNKQDGTTVIVPDLLLQNMKHQIFFQEAMKLDKNQIYVSSINLDINQKNRESPLVPIIRVATPIYDSKNRKGGIFVLNVDFSRVLELLHENMFMQTEAGNLISLKPDGTVNFNKSSYDFSDRSGWLHISDVETIHYSTIEFLPGKRLVLALHHDHPLIKQALQRLVLASVVLLVLFFFMIAIISYINISRFRELIGAQKAIIFSLAKLAEHRDSGTGHHLERTRNYSVILAKQLRKNKKYRRTITNELIEDLFDAAPLHDIGKVGIRDSILLKESKLTQEEHGNMKEHVRIGKQILRDAIDKFKLKQSFLVMGKNICEYHHEKYNGKGYPGLKGTAIPLEARIFTLCDAYDAIRSKRPYKDKLSHEDAVRRIKSDSGEHFDPDIVDAFLKCEKEFATEETQPINYKVL